ncbi:ribose-5-phosphate isomerase A [Polynucleobacter sp. SHI8]|nr:ribose-5-phosphate isomerase A [Polynucleobacter sp. SHI2]BDW13369.1 ribose-5-phosphate isomerase A [Polynucleobacter sp. SHI8]
MMHQDEQKALVAKEAVSLILKEISAGEILGIGTGSTVNLLIDALAPHANHFKGVVSSSEASTARLQGHGFHVLDANEVSGLVAYVDGADEINPDGQMIKGGGGALTREKIVASMSKRFICICDSSKQVAILGKFPLPIEVIPLASGHIQRLLEQRFGGQVQLRHSKTQASEIFVTDNGGWILDVSGLTLAHPKELEIELNQIPGVICNGIFALNPANTLIVSSSAGVKRIDY